MRSPRLFPTINRLQLKVLSVIVVIIVVPMLVTGLISAVWIANRMETSIERWIREAAQINRTWMDSVQANADIFATFLEVQNNNQDSPPEITIAPRMLALAKHLGLEVIQIYDDQKNMVYSSLPVQLALTWDQDQTMGIVRASWKQSPLLAVVRILPYPPSERKGYHLVLGSLFDKGLLRQLSQMSGLRTRIFYPADGGFAKAFGDHSRLLDQRLPTSAYTELMNHKEYFSDRAEGGQFWGLYTPIVDTQNGKVEAILFCGLEHHGNNGFLTDKIQLFLAITTFGLVLAGTMGWLLGRLVVRPIGYLLEGVTMVAAQDFRVAIPITTNDELGDLARSFNAMARSLRDARDQRQKEFQRDKITALGELSLAMAHEIKNPIGVIKTASRLLETTREPQSRQELQRMITEESQRLDQLLRDFQRLARHQPPDFHAIDPLQPLEKVLRELTIDRPNIQIQRHYNHGNATIDADANLLHQAWGNLVSNALEAMGGEDGVLEVSSRLNQEWVEIRLKDNGPGIALEHISRIFEPFFTTKEQGTGLGLTIAANLLEANGASLTLDHQVLEHQGASFIVRIRCTNPARENER
ncbi:MAG: HAMP domain-containing histidine kinase [Magnetococcales bacterium]|nr:HAMP domain-containing histidine kinase [Magnetococcales bacterium]